MTHKHLTKAEIAAELRSIGRKPLQDIPTEVRQLAARLEYEVTEEPETPRSLARRQRRPSPAKPDSQTVTLTAPAGTSATITLPFPAEVVKKR